ncbi:M67 family metallopeptidase [Methylocaldum sp. RMAD-M]|uniref:Mov34/MPN/PAD-1 family protein n=1 Tax=Methylocaldum sp. RMAD-M TaxID=2806557 RepID=UPI000A32857F|nr:M67 family metallopeptidase [Methylocaldum sp. RMAD-M]MBP1149503.1 proteasome lid subunit RPN8/RPN11 [Methylocaldum sp. RMAD-M]
MHDKEIHIPRPLVNQLLHYAQTSPEVEVCGLIGAKDGTPGHCYPVKNASTTPDCRFQMEPQDQIDAMRKMRERGEELFAIFHSHPAAPAEPSAIDLEQAAYPDAVYIIISLNTKGVLEMRGFRINQARQIEEIALLL